MNFSNPLQTTTMAPPAQRTRTTVFFEGAIPNDVQANDVILRPGSTVRLVTAKTEYIFHDIDRYHHCMAEGGNYHLYDDSMYADPRTRRTQAVIAGARHHRGGLVAPSLIAFQEGFETGIIDTYLQLSKRDQNGNAMFANCLVADAAVHLFIDGRQIF